MSAEEEKRKKEEEERERTKANRISLESAVEDRIKRQLQNIMGRAEVTSHDSHVTFNGRSTGRDEGAE